MADLTIEILTNREKYPDTAEITLSDGQKVTVKQFRDALQPRADFTRASESWSKEKKDLEGAVSGLQGQLAKALEEKKVAEEKVAAPPARVDGRVTEDELLADPILGPLVKDLREAKTALKTHEDRLKQHEDTWMRREYTGQLTNLGQRFTSRFNKDGKGKAWDQKAFLDFVLQRGTTDLELAFDSFTRADELVLTAKEAEERGVEKGKTTAKVPPVPFGRRRTPVKAEGLPETFQQLDDEKIAADPDMLEAIRAGEETG